MIPRIVIPTTTRTLVPTITKAAKVKPIITKDITLALSKPLPIISIPPDGTKGKKIPIVALAHAVPAIPIKVSLCAPKVIQPSDPAPNPYPILDTLVDGAGKPITLDPSQLHALELAISGQDFSIIGKAGTGKSTLVQAISLIWLDTHPWTWIEYRIKGQGKHDTAPSIAVVAYTNQAADNIRGKLCSHPLLATKFGLNVTTVHNLLEYTVEYLVDEEGNTKRRYYPQKDKDNKLAITHLVLEEASMLGVGDLSLWQQLFDALPNGVQIMLLGDINQLPPVIGKSILAYALQQIPVAELQTVHRTALDSPIIRQALNCLEGKPIIADYNQVTKQGVRVFNGKQKIKVCHDRFELGFAGMIKNLIRAREYDPMTDMILSPFFKPNKSGVSACNLAKIIATIVAHQAGKEVHEIKAGFTTKYLSIGDRVFIDKVEGIVTRIENNIGYTGKLPRPASTGMDYDGNMVATATDDTSDFGEYNYTTMDIDTMLEAKEEKKRSASHIVTIRDKNTDAEYKCSTLGDFSTLYLGYALSIHKAQGSEWPNVIVVLHDSNAVQLYRESLYTAITRARYRLDIMAQGHVLAKAQANQRIKGNSLAAKIEYFNGGYLDQIVDISKPKKSEE